jgi:hypothetical protein
MVMKEVCAPDWEKGFMKELREFFIASMRAEYCGNHRDVICKHDYAGAQIRSIYCAEPWHMVEHLSAWLDEREIRTSILRTILCNDSPVWEVHIFGRQWADVSAQTCLDNALRDAYGKGDYVGGRGHGNFRHSNGYVYTNSPCHPSGDWTIGDLYYCRGCDEVRDLAGVLKIHNKYHSMVLGRA